MHTKIVDLKEYSSDEVGLLVQAVLMEMLLIFEIMFMPHHLLIEIN